MISVAIVGVSGYTGLELIKLLIDHPKFELKYICASKEQKSILDIHPSLQNIFEIEIKKADAKEIAKVAKLVFLALPHKTAMNFAKELLEYDIKVVDLSADYRLDLKTYEKHYCNHVDQKNLQNSVYGLPEIYKEEIKKANLIANPGCSATVGILSLLPFVELIDIDYPIFIDAKNGISGAGKKCTQNTHFVTINENSFAYNPLIHRHEPEILEKLKMVKNVKFDINFVPHLIPATRGILASTYLRLKKEIDPLEHLKKFYKNEKFIRIFEKPVDLKSCVGTNFCDIFATNKGKNLYISSAIDNLLRGASSQAVVNANLMFGFSESLAIPTIPNIP